jgi:hypothetical protein
MPLLPQLCRSVILAALERWTDRTVASVRRFGRGRLNRGGTRRLAQIPPPVASKFRNSPVTLDTMWACCFAAWPCFTSTAANWQAMILCCFANCRVFARYVATKSVAGAASHTNLPIPGGLIGAITVRTPQRSACSGLSWALLMPTNSCRRPWGSESRRDRVPRLDGARAQADLRAFP